MTEPTDLPSAVTLDLWHTLVYLTPQDEEAYMEDQMELATSVIARAPSVPGSPPLDRAEIRSIFERVYAEAVAAAHDGRTVTPAQQLAIAAGRAGRVARPEEYVTGLRSLVARQRFRPGPEAVRTVEQLREHGWRTAVISNTIGEPGATLLPILRSIGFDSSVEEYIFSDEHPWAKPSPEIFREALRRLGVRPDRTVHVGDGWSDIEGARRAGLRAGILFTGLQEYGARYQALFLPSGWASPPTEYRIERIDALPGLAARLLGDGGASP